MAHLQQTGNLVIVLYDKKECGNEIRCYRIGKDKNYSGYHAA